MLLQGPPDKVFTLQWYVNRCKPIRCHEYTFLAGGRRDRGGRLSRVDVTVRFLGRLSGPVRKALSGLGLEDSKVRLVCTQGDTEYTIASSHIDTVTVLLPKVIPGTEILGSERSTLDPDNEVSFTARDVRDSWRMARQGVEGVRK